MAPKYIIDLFKANEPKRDNMQSNQAGLKLKVLLVQYNTFATRSFSYTDYGIHTQLTSKNAKH